jgi:hypothetical protein
VIWKVQLQIKCCSLLFPILCLRTEMGCPCPCSCVTPAGSAQCVQPSARHRPQASPSRLIRSVAPATLHDAAATLLLMNCEAHRSNTAAPTVDLAVQYASATSNCQRPTEDVDRHQLAGHAPDRSDARQAQQADDEERPPVHASSSQSQGMHLLGDAAALQSSHGSCMSVLQC